MDDDTDEPLRVPPPLPVAARPAIPVATAIVPVVGAVVLWQVTGSAFALLFAALGPVMAVASLADSWRHTRRARRRAQRERAAAIEALGKEIEARHARERARAWRRTPDVVGYAASPDDIWRAVPGRDDVVVVGRGRGASGVRIDGVSQEYTTRGEKDEPVVRELLRRARVLDDVPVAVPIEAGIAVCGPPLVAAAVARALAAQVCLTHSPANLRLIGAEAELRAVPHRSTTRGRVVFLGDAGEPIPDDADLPIIRVAEGAPPPPRCAAVMTLGAAGSARLDHAGSSFEVAVEAVSREQADALAAVLAARAATLGHRVDGALDLDELAPVGGGRKSLGATIGVSGGRPVTLDLVADGPHAVVIGVTGSGKSELLTSWMIAMCRTRTPQEVSLLLVDFKGGRTFDPLHDLPHVTGVVTDLDEGSALRAVESLRAEVRFRERVLAREGAREIDEASDVLARLVIVVDEYAALVTARPELHDLFADIAARGRALGMHLVLASQRAGGAFRDGVLANAPLRIAFRVTDASDSRTILGHDDAALLPGVEAARGIALVRRAVDSAPQRVRVARCSAVTIAAVVSSSSAWPAARRPWLPPLPERIDLEQVRTLTAASASDIVIGLADEPEHQRQTAVTLPREAPGLVVVGGAGSGRTTALRAIAQQAPTSIWVPADPEGAWDALHALDDARPGTVVLIDDADALPARLGAEHGAAWLATLDRSCREARGRGLTMVLSVTRPTGALARILDLLPHRLVLPVASRAEHVAAGGESSDFVAGAAAGRARWGRLLVQLPLPGAGPDGDSRATGTTAQRMLGRDVPVMPLERDAALAVVVPYGGRRDLVRAACDRAEASCAEVGDLGASPAGSEDDIDVLIGTPDAWLAQWRVLARARERRAFLVDAACAAELRAVTGSRDFPPFATAGLDRAWLLRPGRATERVRFPAG